MKWFLKRLREPSTWASLAAVFPAVSAASAAGNTTVTVISGVLAALGVLLPEDTRKARDYVR